jgi:tungstate transport system substrate-binding protein
MRRRFALLLTLLVALATVLSACAPAVSTPAQPAAPTAAAAPTQAPAPTTAADPTAATAANAAPAKLVLATTTSTADSGLLDHILPDFEKKTGSEVDVVAVGTGQALEIGAKGDADVLLVHSRKGEDQFVADGNARQRYDVMYNDYIIVGPKEDPAKIKGITSASDAYQAIMDGEHTFVSRGDKSGTNTKELSIWATLQVTPTQDMPWYNSIGQGMGDTLLFANEKLGYTLSDRGTYLSMRDKLPALEVLVGGSNLAENADKSLLNPYGVLPVNPEKHPAINAALAQQFVEWILSPEVQKMIGEFGVDTYGQPLFYASANQ